MVTAGRKPEENFGIVNPPVYHASTVTFPTVAAMEKAKETRFESVYYGRYGTPTTFAFEEAVAALEGGEKTIAVPSGMAAIAGPLLALLKAGDHVVAAHDLFGATVSMFTNILSKFGIEFTFVSVPVGSSVAWMIMIHRAVERILHVRYQRSECHGFGIERQYAGRHGGLFPID